MAGQFSLNVSSEFHQTPDQIWQILTTPGYISRYLFGTEAISGWKTGDSLVFRGVWEGTRYEDKGIILEAVPGKTFRYTYLSSLSGLPDTPENYAEVGYFLESVPGGTRLTITQNGIQDEERRAHSEKSWLWVAGEMKKVLDEVFPEK